MNKLNEKLTQLEEQTAALVIEAAELRKQLERPANYTPIVDKFGRYMSEPEHGMDYFYSTAIGQTSGVCWFNDDSDTKLLDCGNAFDTKENAEHQAKRNKLTQAARVFMHKDRAENEGKSLRYVIYRHELTLIECEYLSTRDFLRFTSEQVRAQFRNEFSDSDIRMILGVE